MIFHFSMSAAEPERVAKVIAELWDGEALPFPPVAEGSWMAMAGDDRNSAIEVYPAGTLLVPADGDADSLGIADPAATRHTATHAAIATPLSQAQVEAIGKREGWLTKYRKRGNVFGVIEFWIENSVMLEVLPAEMQREYLEGVSIEQWRAMLAAGPYPRAA